MWRALIGGLRVGWSSGGSLLGCEQYPPRIRNRGGIKVRQLALTDGERHYIESILRSSGAVVQSLAWSTSSTLVVLVSMLVLEYLIK